MHTSTLKPQKTINQKQLHNCCFAMVNNYQVIFFFTQKAIHIVSITFIYLQDFSVRNALAVTMCRSPAWGILERKQNGIFNTHEEY